MSDSSTKGFSTLDFTVLPRPQLLVVRYLMRQQEASAADIQAAIAKTENKRPTPEQVETALAALCEKEWLVETQAPDGSRHYTVKTSRRAAREVSKAPGQDIWGKISGDTEHHDADTTQEIEHKSRGHLDALRDLGAETPASSEDEADASETSLSDDDEPVTLSTRPTEPDREQIDTDALRQAAADRRARLARADVETAAPAVPAEPDSASAPAADEPDAPTAQDTPDTAPAADDQPGGVKRRLGKLWDSLTGDRDAER